MKHYLLFLLTSLLFGNALNLEPARWIWYPSSRTPQNTFVLFRKDFDVKEVPSEARGWIVAATASS